VKIDLPVSKEEDTPFIHSDSTEFDYNEEKITINVNQLHGKELGKGQFGSVHLVKIPSSTDISIAVKVSQWKYVNSPPH